MGKSNQENVRLVISHIEGCAGNFLARLYADHQLDNQVLFKTDLNNLHPKVLATDKQLSHIHKLDQHTVVVTHNFDVEFLSTIFPAAKFIQIYPYTHIGNVLYNICFKKLSVKMDNVVDNHLLHIQEWFNRIQSSQPTTPVTDYWQLTDQYCVEELLGIKFNSGQQKFFDDYWQKQLKFELIWPNNPVAVDQLITDYEIDNYFSPWFVAWIIFVYEKSNKLEEYQRTWSIDAVEFESWDDVRKIQYQYK